MCYCACVYSTHDQLHPLLSKQGCFWLTRKPLGYAPNIAGNFRAVQIFLRFRGRAVNVKINWYRNSHTPVFHMQSLLVRVVRH